MTNKPPSDDDYEVGYGKPPKHSRFKPGQSGNPKGRPKGARNFTTELREELNKRVPIREDGQVRRVSKRLAIVKALLAKGMSGDPRAVSLVLNLIATYLADDENRDAGEHLSPDDKAILAAFLENYAGKSDARR